MKYQKAVNPGFSIKIMEATCALRKKPLRTTSGTRTTGWEPLFKFLY